jgi:serine/threonine-protein kinase
MSAQRERWVEELFHEALELPADKRKAFVEHESDGDFDVAAEVLSLLAAHRGADPLLEQAAPELLHTTARDPVAGRMLGPYRVLGELGHGGMGSVLLAERVDGAFDRRVAIKVVQRGALAWNAERRQELERRFLAERRVLAALDHPHIARLLDAGATDAGEPYLVMELVEGTPIDRFCREQALSLPARLELFRSVCLAVHSAHQRLIAHRDIKPANILVALHAARPQPKLLDFGIAKLLDGSEDGARTTLGSTRLTPAYASPEQFRGEPASIASDVYSLGVVLYELVTGRLPYEVARTTPEALSHAVCNLAPTAPSKIDRALTGDLETILLKVLEKEPARRYESAAALADDLERFVTGHTIRARPATLAYRASKLIRRHRTAAALGATAVAALAGLGIWSALLRNASVEAREVADRERAAALTATSLFREIFAAPMPYQRHGKDVTVVQVLDLAAPRVLAGLEGQPEVRFDLEGMLGETYMALGAPTKAEPHARAAWESALGLFEATDERRWEATVRWVRTLIEVGRPTEAEPIARELIDIVERTPAVDRELALTVREAWCGTLREIGRSAEAEELARVLAEESRAVRGEADARTLSHVVDLSSILIDRPALAEAQELLERTLDAVTEDESTAQALAAVRYNLGFLYHRKGELARARALFEQVYAARLRRLGEEHVDTLEVLHELAGIEMTLGDVERGMQHMRAIVAALTGLRGRDHPDTIAAETTLAVMLTERGEFGEALAMLDGAWRRSVEANGAEHYASTTTQAHLVFTLAASGALDDAILMQRELIDLIDGSTDPRDALRSRTRNNLGQFYLKAGRFDEAEQVQLEVVAFESAVLGPGDPSTLVARANLGAIRRARGDWEGAQQELLAVVDDGERALGTANTLVGGFREGAAKLALFTQDWDGAECHLLEAYALYARVLGREHPVTAQQLEQITSMWSRLGRHERIERVLARIGGGE